MPKLLFSAIVTSLLVLVSTARGGQSFSTSTGDSTITSDYNQLVSFAGYDPGQNDSAQFWQTTHDAGNTLYQDRVSTDPPDFHPTSVPEPSRAVMGAFGLLFVLRFVARNRARRRYGCH